MTTPTYVAKRMGDEFVLVRVDGPGMLLRIGSVAAGLYMVKKAARGRGLFAAAAAVAGVGLAYHGWTGRDPVRQLMGSKTASHGDKNESPSQAHEAGGQRVQVPADKLEEAQMESFPASDAPARSSH